MSLKDNKKQNQNGNTDMTVPTPNKPTVVVDPTLQGMEIKQEFLVVPRVKLIQPSSSTEIEQGHKAGTFMNNLTQQNYGAEIVIRPLSFQVNRILYFPMEDGGGRECTAWDGILGDVYGECDKCSRNYDFTKKNEKTNCTKFMAYPSIVKGDPLPASVSFHSTGMRAGKMLYTLLSLQVNAIKWYKITCTLQTKGVFKWYAPNIIADADLNSVEIENFKVMVSRFAKVRTAYDDKPETEPSTF